MILYNYYSPCNQPIIPTVDSQDLVMGCQPFLPYFRAPDFLLNPPNHTTKQTVRFPRAIPHIHNHGYKDVNRPARKTSMRAQAIAQNHENGSQDVPPSDMALAFPVPTFTASNILPLVLRQYDLFTHVHWGTQNIHRCAPQPLGLQPLPKGSHESGTTHM